MSKQDKRLQKIQQNLKNVSLHDLQTLLEDYGFYLDRIAGSHYIFRAEIEGNVWKLTIPYQKPIKAIYVKQSLKAIEEIQAIQADDEE